MGVAGIPQAGEGDMTKLVQPAEGAETDFRARMSYSDYLHLEEILDAQAPLSSAHDELLFIIQHQTSELWMKLAIHEIRSAKAAIHGGDLQPAFKMLTRVARIFEQLNSAWDVLRTMTPSEYTQFRDSLGQSSGFQSWQYRAIEFLAGNRNEAMLKPHAHREEVLAELEKILAEPSLYDEALLLLAREGFDIGPDAKRTNWRQSHQPSEEVLAAWKRIYQAPEQHWALYELAEKLVDFEDYFRRWRFNHVTTVERIIGLKRGTGGTAGVSYLRKMLEVELFPELWKLRTEL
jgi:tryptophan 2,3-dioxygenase